MKFTSCGLYSATCAVALFCFSALATGVKPGVSLAWSGDSSGSIAGYVVYCGNTSQNYTTRVDVGTNTHVTLSDLVPQSTNYFAITAYDAWGMESAPSSELVAITPVVLTIIPPSGPGGFAFLQFPVMAGHWYELQACANLTGWTTIWLSPVATANGTASYPDMQVKDYTSRYYRLKLH